MSERITIALTLKAILCPYQLVLVIFSVLGYQTSL